MRRGIAIKAGIVVLGVLWWAFPPFHVRSLKAIHAAQIGAQFNVTNFVADFWKDRLLIAAEQAADAAKVLEAIAIDPQEARKRFGRSVEIGGTYSFFLQGAGWVATVSADNIGLSLKPDGNAVDISIPLGPVFGNAVRDGSGLLNASDYPNAQQFNDLAAGLNQIVETQVLPDLQRMAKPGTRIRFAGCVEVADEESDLKPLKVVPVFVKKE